MCFHAAECLQSSLVQIGPSTGPSWTFFRPAPLIVTAVSDPLSFFLLPIWLLLAGAWLSRLGDREKCAKEEEKRSENNFLNAELPTGEKAHFRALGHTFITMVNSSGADPNVVKTLARHSSFKLPYDRYCHTRCDELREAGKNMPLMLSGELATKSGNIETTATKRSELEITGPKLCLEGGKNPELVTTINETESQADLAEQQKNPKKHSVSLGFSEKAPVGVEPTMTDLQSDQEATPYDRGLR